jgi:putative GTP pyrophosphokinase
MDNARVDVILREYDRGASLCEDFGRTIQKLLSDILRASNIPINSVTYRLKERNSLEGKVRSNSKYVSLSDVTDTIGARVITYFEGDVNRVADVIRQKDNFEIDPKHTTDKRSALRIDQFGYRSLHLVGSLSRRRIFIENRVFESLNRDTDTLPFAAYVGRNRTRLL